MTRRVASFLVLASLLLSGCAFLVHQGGGPTVDAAPPVPAELAAALAANGIDTSPIGEVERQQVRDAGVSPETALLVAGTQFPFPDGDLPVAYLAHVSVDYGPRDILAYVVQITGLDLPPMGAATVDGSPMPDDPATHNHEMIVLVDAMTGTLLRGTTFR